MAVAALVYFEDGTTVSQAKAVLRDLKDTLDNHQHPLDECDGAAIDHAIINEYDPQYGGPVWYIP
jgi:hypothetical protein